MIRKYVLNFSRVAAIALMLAPFPALADVQSDYDSIINENTWYMRDLGNESNCTDSSGGDVNLVGKDNVQKAFNFLVGKGLSSIQAAAIVGNLVAESGVDPAINQGGGHSHTTPVNGEGFGIAQWTYSTRQQPLVDFAKKMGKPVNTLEPQLGYLWQEMTSGYKSSVLDPLKAATDLRAATVIVILHYEAPRDKDIPSFQDYRTSLARKVLDMYGNGQQADNITTNDTGTTTCDNGNSVISGDIVQTAANLAWWPSDKEYSETQKTPKPAYKKVWDGASNYTDCGAFVASVMIATGADKNYPKVGTSIQLAYLKSHADKYLVIDHPTSTSQLQPGDILVYPGHTFLYLGSSTPVSGYVVAEASLDGDIPGHVPILNKVGSVSWILAKSGVIAARIKK